MDNPHSLLETASIIDFNEKWSPHYDAYPYPTVVAQRDSDGRIIIFNSQAETLWGYHRSHILGHPVEDLMPERFRDRHRQHRSHYNEEPAIRMMGRDLKLHILRKDGQEREVLIYLGPLTVPEGELVVIVAQKVLPKASEPNVPTP